MCDRTPEPLDVEFGEVKQNGRCMDTLGKGVGTSPELFKCHGSGGNQVRERRGERERERERGEREREGGEGERGGEREREGERIII